MTTTCVLCGMSFDARTSYGLCPLCIRETTLREWDRLHAALSLAEKAGVPATLTLPQWLQTVSDCRGKCAFCEHHFMRYIEIIDAAKGLTYDNIVPICNGCSVHRRRTFAASEDRVRAYLSGKPKIEQLSDAFVNGILGYEEAMSRP